MTPSRRMIAATLALAASGLALVPIPAAAGVVVSASGPSASGYPVGRKIGESERIVLRAGDTLTVLDGRGTRVLRGAGTYSLDQQSGPGKRGTFAVLTERRSAQRVRTGAVRTGASEGAVHPPSLWYVDVSRGGTICLADASRVRLWRAAADGEASFVISAAEGGATETVTFADGEMLAPWNVANLPVSARSIYRLAGAEGATARELNFVLLDSVAEEPEALTQQLIDNGCMAQLDVLVAATMLDEA